MTFDDLSCCLMTEKIIFPNFNICFNIWKSKIYQKTLIFVLFATTKIKKKLNNDTFKILGKERKEIVFVY